MTIPDKQQMLLIEKIIKMEWDLECDPEKAARYKKVLKGLEFNTFVEFAEPKTIQEADMLEALEGLTPEQRTPMMADWYIFWHTWQNLANAIEVQNEK